MLMVIDEEMMGLWGQEGGLHVGFRTLWTISVIDCVCQQSIEKVLAVQSCSQATRKQREEKDA